VFLHWPFAKEEWTGSNWGAIFLAYQEWMQFKGTTTHDSNQYFLAKGSEYLVCVVDYGVVAYPTV